MKTPLSALLVVVPLFLLATPLAAQIDFGIAPYCVPLNAYPAKKLSREALRTLFSEANAGADLAQYSLGQDAAAEAEGFETDFDSDGRTEMMLLLHSGPEMTGLNTLFLVRQEAASSYRLLDIFKVAPGKALNAPIRLLPTGMQFYAQSVYTTDDGSTETKGAFFTVEKEVLMPLISWVAKDGITDGVRSVKKLQCGIADFDYHGVKEIFLKISTHQPGAGKPDEKNLTDCHVLTLQFLATQYRYTLYDSSGYDKIQQAEKLASAGARLLYNEKTAEDGIIKLKEAIALDPFQTDARLSLGRHYLRTGKISDAERAFSQAIEMDPMTAESYAGLGDTYIKINDLQKTLDNYRKYLELKPDGREAKRIKRNIKQITVPKIRR